MPMAAPSSTVFACEWAARRLPAAASPGQELVTVTCIGRVHAGQIIQVLTSGSTRVRLLGCPESRCRHEHGVHLARDQVATARRLLHTLGRDPDSVTLDTVGLDADAMSGWWFADRAAGPTDAKPGRSRREPRIAAPDRMATAAAWFEAVFTCQDCGKCVGACPVARSGLGFSPRRALQRARREGLSPDQARGIFACLGCDRCATVCPSGLVVSGTMVRLRTAARTRGLDGELAHGGVLQALMRSQAETDTPQRRLDSLGPPLETSTTGPVAFFVGCAPYFEPVFGHMAARPLRTVRNTVRLLNRVGVRPVLLADERCCGHDLLWSGDVESFEKLGRHNLAQMAASGVQLVVTHCPECLRTFQLDYPERLGPTGLETAHISEYLLRHRELLRAAALPGRVTFHDPCRLGRHLGVYDPPRELLKAVPGLDLVEMKHAREAATCCGGVAWTDCGASVKRLQAERLDEARATGAQRVVTGCPKCDIHLRCALCGPDRTPAPAITNMVDLLAEACGIDEPDAGAAHPAGKGD